MNKVKPFLKWPGGKRRVLPEIKKYIPQSYERYYEGFLGGGAVLFDLQPNKASVSDINDELINTYQVIRDKYDALIDVLTVHSTNNSLEYFLDIRAKDRDLNAWGDVSDVEKAARMIYLNRTCFNGIYRVNSKNQFNVPFGKYENPKIVDEDNLKAISSWFKTIDISFSADGYQSTIIKAGMNDFVYLDPPYIPLTNTSSFVSYTKDGFDINDQIELRDLASDINQEGGYVLLSNSDTPQVRELYKDFHIEGISVHRSVGAAAGTRKTVGEVLILGEKLANEKL